MRGFSWSPSLGLVLLVNLKDPHVTATNFQADQEDSSEFGGRMDGKLATSVCVCVRVCVCVCVLKKKTSQATQTKSF